MRTLCLICQKEEALKDPIFGLLPCNSCRVSTKKTVPFEAIPDRIKEDRKEHKDATVQPFYKGVLNKHYYDLYGDRYIKVDRNDLKKMKYTDSSYYKNI